MSRCSLSRNHAKGSIVNDTTVAAAVPLAPIVADNSRHIPLTNGHAPDAFDLSSLAYSDTAEMVVEHPGTGEPTTWKITFAGPGHPVSVALGDEIAKRAIRDRKAREAAQVNGRKWKPEDETPEQNREENGRYYAKRMLGWTPVRLVAGADPVPFSLDNATRLLIDPKFLWLYRQVTAFLAADAGFIESSEIK
jgi:hypothetical protein